MTDASSMFGLVIQLSQWWKAFVELVSSEP